MEQAKKTWTTLRVYLLIASIVGLIGGLVALGVALTSLLQRLIITNEEFVQGQGSYEIDQCKQPYYYGKIDTANQNRKPSIEQIKTCEAEKTNQVLLRRNVDTKMTIIGGGIRAILFAILFFTHYPRFRRENKE
jgi:hypothetical protein